MSLISHTPEACRGLVDGGLPAKISIVRLVFGPGRFRGMYYLPFLLISYCPNSLYSILPSYEHEGYPGAGDRKEGSPF